MLGGGGLQSGIWHSHLPHPKHFTLQAYWLSCQYDCMCRVVKISDELQLCFPLSVPHHMTGNNTASSIDAESECTGLNAYCSSSTHEHPPSQAHTTNLHEPNSAGMFPMLLTNSKTHRRLSRALIQKGPLCTTVHWSPATTVRHCWELSRLSSIWKTVFGLLLAVQLCHWRTKYKTERRRKESANDFTLLLVWLPRWHLISIVMSSCSACLAFQISPLTGVLKTYIA